MTPSANHRALHYFAVFLAFATFVLVLAGGLVTSTGSALAVPDWPLSFGQFFPPLVGGVFYEHGHRLIAATVGFLTILLALWIWRTDSRPVVRALGGGAVAVVCVQGLLGGITVLLKLPPLISVAHACLGQTFFCLVACIAVLTGPNPPSPPFAKGGNKGGFLRLGLMTTAFIYFQLIVGATLRHSTLRLIHLHLLVAFLVLVHVALLVRRTFKEYKDHLELTRPALALGGLLGIQLILGFFAWQRGGTGVTTAHVGVGALILASSVILTLQAFRRLV